MLDVRIILSALWIALMFLFQQGDVLRLYSAEFIPGKTKLGEMMSPGTLWMVSALTMTIPIAMIILSLTLPYKMNRWINIIAAVLFFIYTLVGVRSYPSAYDRFLLVVSLAFNALTVWYAWHWTV